MGEARDAVHPLTLRARRRPGSRWRLGRQAARASIALAILACAPIADIAKDPTTPNDGGQNDASSNPLDGAAPDAAGDGAADDAWPNAGNTGWLPTGVTLTRHDGDLIVTTPGEVVDALDVYGTVYARAANVTLKRSRVHGQIDNESADRTQTFAGLVIEDVELDGAPFVSGVSAFRAPIGRSSYTARRCNVHDWGGGFSVAGGVVLEDNFVHDIVSENGAAPGDSSNYAVTSNGGSGIVVRHNNLQCLSMNCSGSLALYGDNAPIDDALVEHNLFNGGRYCVYGGSVAGKPFPRATRVRFVDNHFGRAFAARCATNGPAIDFDGTASGNAWSGNVWDDTGQIVDP